MEGREREETDLPAALLTEHPHIPHACGVRGWQAPLRARRWLLRALAVGAGPHLAPLRPSRRLASAGNWLGRPVRARERSGAHLERII